MNERSGTAESVPGTSPVSTEPPDASALTPAEYWEERYGSADRVWSGNVNQVLSDIAGTLSPGTALDLGCGEGGDVIWLAQHGWEAVGVDISNTATDRAAEAARAAGLGEAQAGFRVADLSTFDTDEEFDLVTASFLHSTAELPREDILRRAAGWVAPGGHLLITVHAEAPPWAAHLHEAEEAQQEPAERDGNAERDGHAEHDEHSAPLFPTPQQEVESLALDESRWETRVAETRAREATGPNDETAILRDGVVLLRRVSR